MVCLKRTFTVHFRDFIAKYLYRVFGVATTASVINYAFGRKVQDAVYRLSWSYNGPGVALEIPSAECCYYRIKAKRPWSWEILTCEMAQERVPFHRRPGGGPVSADYVHTQMSGLEPEPRAINANASQYLEFMIQVTAAAENEGGHANLLTRVRYSEQRDATILVLGPVAINAFAPTPVFSFLELARWHINYDVVNCRVMRYETLRADGAPLNNNSFRKQKYLLTSQCLDLSLHLPGEDNVVHFDFQVPVFALPENEEQRPTSIQPYNRSVEEQKVGSVVENVEARNLGEAKEEENVPLG
jgi:hypothetical protein